MKARKILGIVGIIAGAALLYFAHYIEVQVEQGKEQISSAQKTVDTTKNLFSVSPATKEIGNQLSSPVQNKINAGIEQAEQYAQYANWFMIGGAVLIVIGAGALLIGKKRKS